MNGGDGMVALSRNRRFVATVLKRPSFRRFLYLHSKRLGPLRSLAARAVWGYRAALLENGVEMWDSRIGVLYDLGYRLHSESDRHDAMCVHYAYSIDLLREAIRATRPRSIIDYGCGPGILTEYIAELVQESVAIVGADIREETLSYNRLLRPDIEWCLVDRIPHAELEHPRLIVLDGVVNYMSQSELRVLLKAGDAFFFFYASKEDEGAPLFANFHLFDLLHEAGLQEHRVRSLDRGPDGPTHVLCLAYPR